MIIAALILLFSPPQDEEKFDRKLHPWLKFKLGSSVTFKYVSKSNFGEQEFTSRETLKEIGKKDFTVENEFRGKNLNQTDKKKNAFPTNDGKGKVKVGEKEYECTIWKMDKDGNTRVWLDEKGRFLKTVSKIGKDTEIAIVAVAEGEEIKVGEKTISCVKLEGTTDNPGGGTDKLTMWISPEVPGGTVKLLRKLETKTRTVTTTAIVTSFEVKK